MSILDVLSGGNTPTILCLAFGALCVFWLLTKRKGYSVRHYQKIPLLTQREQEFFWRLKEAVGNDLVISPQVPFGAFIKVKSTALTYKNHARHVVSHNRCDFLLCNKQLDAVALIEVDDSTHNNRAQRSKDRRRDDLMKAVGVAVHRYKNMPTAAQIRKDLKL